MGNSGMEKNVAKARKPSVERSLKEEFVRELRFHERHFPTFLKFPNAFTRQLHWMEHLLFLGVVAVCVTVTLWQTAQLIALRRAVAEQEAAAWAASPIGTIPPTSLLGEKIICEPALLRWYYGMEPLCDVHLGPVDDTYDY